MDQKKRRGDCRVGRQDRMRGPAGERPQKADSSSRWLDDVFSAVVGPCACGSTAILRGGPALAAGFGCRVTMSTVSIRHAGANEWSLTDG